MDAGGYALVLITGGRLGDAYGRKRLFLTGVAGFTIMSALCGAAQGVFGLAFLLMLARPARRGHNTPAKSV